MITNDCMLETTRRRLMAEGVPLNGCDCVFLKDSLKPYFQFVYYTKRGLHHLQCSCAPTKKWVLPKEVARVILRDIKLSSMNQLEAKEYSRGGGGYDD